VTDGKPSVRVRNQAQYYDQIFFADGFFKYICFGRYHRQIRIDRRHEKRSLDRSIGQSSHMILALPGDDNRGVGRARKSSVLRRLLWQRAIHFCVKTAADF
jgi:hypothetical protein